LRLPDRLGAVCADTHIRVGILPGGGMTSRLPRLVGLGMARRLSMTGEVVDPADRGVNACSSVRKVAIFDGVSAADTHCRG
jgi:hypothetical protein